MFDDKSRYRNVQPFQIADRRGRKVLVAPVPEALLQRSAGEHLLKQGQRIDHLAAHYCGNPTGFWRIAEINDAMLPEAISEKNEITIPIK